MVPQLPTLASILFLFTNLISGPVRSLECIAASAEMLLASPQNELVFSGRVVSRTFVGDAAYRATFEVDRVWKGAVPKRIDIYVWEMKSSEMPRYEQGRDYVVLAGRLTDTREQQAVGLKESDRNAFAALSCGGALQSDIRKQLGDGSRPSSGEALTATRRF